MFSDNQNVRISFKIDTAFKMRNGGLSFEEFNRQAMQFDKKISDKKLQEAFLECKTQELDLWHDVAIDEYYEKLEQSEKDQFYDVFSYFIVPNKTNPEAFIIYLSDSGFIPEDDVEKLQRTFADHKDITSLFDTLNRGKSKELRAELVAETDYPLPLKIYRYKC